MKYLPILILPLMLFSCVSAPSLIPLDESRSGEPGSYFEVKPESSLVQERYEYLMEYLKKADPRLLPMELVRAFGQVADGQNVILVCRYREGASFGWLKAEIRGDREGNIVGRTIQAGYHIEKLEEDLY